MYVRGKKKSPFFDYKCIIQQPQTVPSQTRSSPSPSSLHLRIGFHFSSLQDSLRHNLLHHWLQQAQEAMAGGGSSSSRTLEVTPTWAVAVVCLVLVLISIIIEHVIDLVGKVSRSLPHERVQSHLRSCLISCFVSSLSLSRSVVEEASQESTL